AAGEIWLSENGSNEKLVCRGPSSTFQVNGLQPGVPYLFRLYAVTAQRPLLNEVKFEHEINGQITASPNPIPADAGSNTLLRWEITPPAAGEIWLSENGSNKKLVCRGPSGTFQVNGLQPGVPYLFRLYAATAQRPLLNEVKFEHEINGQLTASPNPIPADAGSNTLLRWEITPPAAGEIWLSENGSNEKLVCRGPSGTFQVNGLQPGVPYLFRLYAATAQRPLLNEVKFEHEINGQLTASPNP